MTKAFTDMIDLVLENQKELKIEEALDDAGKKPGSTAQVQENATIEYQNLKINYKNLSEKYSTLEERLLSLEKSLAPTSAQKTPEINALPAKEILKKIIGELITHSKILSQQVNNLLKKTDLKINRKGLAQKASEVLNYSTQLIKALSKLDI